MKEKRTTKLYEGLSSKRKAALTLHYLAASDDSEIERIRSAVPWKNYRCIDGEYTDWRDALVHISLSWGLMYWKARYVLACAASDVARVDVRNVDNEVEAEFDELEQTTWKILARVVALEAALADVCAEHGIDREDVANAAGVPMKKWPPCEPDAAYREQVRRDLLDCLPNAEPEHV